MKRILISLALLLNACSTGFDRGELKQRLEANSQKITNRDIKEALELKPQLSLPFKLAVFLLDEDRPSYDYSRRGSDRASEWRWDVTDKETIVAWGEQLKAESIVSDMFVISEMIKHGTSLTDIRQAAALQGADAVLALNGITDIDRYQNVAAALYITIVGTYFIPGHTLTLSSL